MVEERFAIGEPDVVAPHSFDFHLRHYVIAPEVPTSPNQTSRSTVSPVAGGGTLHLRCISGR
jgi:hypothetical protein